MKKYLATAAILLFSANLFCQDIPLAEKKLTSFYNWYIASVEQQEQGLIKLVTSPYVIKSKMGKTALQVEEYIRAMRKRGFFTKAFLSAERERLEPCRKKLAQIDYSEYEKSEAYEYEPECSFFYYKYWAGGHDLPSGITIKESRMEQETIVISFAFYEIYQNKTFEWPHKGRAVMKKEGSEWKIETLNISVD